MDKLITPPEDSIIEFKTTQAVIDASERIEELCGNYFSYNVPLQFWWKCDDAGKNDKKLGFSILNYMPRKGAVVETDDIETFGKILNEQELADFMLVSKAVLENLAAQFGQVCSKDAEYFISYPNTSRED